MQNINLNFICPILPLSAVTGKIPMSHPPTQVLVTVKLNNICTLKYRTQSYPPLCITINLLGTVYNKGLEGFILLAIN